MAHTGDDTMSGNHASEDLPRREKRTQEYYQRIGAIGGKTIKERYGSAYYAAIGRKGGLKTKTLFGRAHYQRMGRRGGGARQRKG